MAIRQDIEKAAGAIEHANAVLDASGSLEEVEHACRDASTFAESAATTCRELLEAMQREGRS
jgi:hypothetical protein